MLRDLNLFSSEPRSVDQLVLRDQRLSTRIFIVLFISSFLIVLVYLSTKQIIGTVSITNPNYVEYLDLHAKQQQSLSCSCSQALIKYAEFVHIDYAQHQVCTSVFVTDEWINYIKVISWEDAVDHVNDFLTAGTKLFDGLRRFCQMANRTISEGLIRLYTDRYLTTSLRAPNEFQTQIETLFQQFLSSITNNFQSSLRLFDSVAHVNAFWSGASVNYYFYFLPNDYFASTGSIIVSNYSCKLAPSYTADFYIYGPYSAIPSTVPGLYTGCLSTVALLNSNLHCFYDQKCISEIQSHINGSDKKTFTPLDSSRPSRFTPESSVNEMMEKMLVETWNLSYQYENYYNKCNPHVCTYTDVHHCDGLFIVTALLSLVGGAVMLLRLMIPNIVECGRQVQLWIVNRRQEDTPPAHFSLPELIMKSCRYFQSLNVFESVPPSLNENEIRQQRISTKLYIILLCSGVIILFGYMLSIHASKTDRILSPTIEQYLSLYEKYSSTISCPCSQVSIDYESFVDIQYTLHDVCQSVFITQFWFHYLVEATQNLFLSSLDFRWISPWTFQTLHMFCEMINQMIFNTLNNFYLDLFVNDHLIAQDSFQVQINAIVDQLITETAARFSSLLKTVQDMNQANGIMSVVGTQYLIYRHFLNASAVISFTANEQCSCAQSGKCITEAAMMDDSTNIVHSMTGMHTGCIVTEALLQSSLICLYDQTCINTFLSYFDFPPLINITALNASALQKHRINSTVQELVDHLMVEQWNVNVDYKQYYNHCRPVYCSYTYKTQNDIIYLVATLFGLIGGLAIILRIITPYWVKFIQNFLEFFTSGQQNTLPDDNRIEQLEIEWWLRMINSPLELNYFTSKPPTTDPKELTRQKIATRIYIILFMIFTTVLITCNSFITTEKNIIVKKPSLEQYFYYSQVQSQTFSCRCSKMVMDYHRFLQINHIKHPLCQSLFVTSTFRETLLSAMPNAASDTSSSPHETVMVFQGLEELCRMVNRTIQENIDVFFSKKYITSTVPSLALFHSQTQIMFDTFLSSMIDTFLHAFESVQDLTQTNGLFSGKMTNYHIPLVPISGSDDTYLVIPKSKKYGDCDCAITSKCVKPVTIEYGSNMENEFWLTGLYLGCYITVGLLQSNLECLFSSRCLSDMRSHLIVSSSLQMYPLDRRILRQSNTNSTIQELLNRMFVEEWSFTQSFANYYNECAPNECSYIEVTRQEPIYMVTAAFGVMAGLTVVLKPLVQIITKSLSLWIRKDRQRVVPHAILT